MEPRSEAEIQALIALIEVEEPKETPNNNFYRFYPADLEQASKYFRDYCEDWDDALRVLTSMQLVYADSVGYRLTPAGRAVASRWREERPPIWYWYKDFYTQAPLSPTYREFCERLYGRYLCQQSFSDMAQIDTMLRAARLSSSSRVLELGCGLGMLAEYISDTTGAFVHGVDYAPDAIAQALARAACKRDRMTFETGNMDSLSGAPHAFDAILSVDTLYMPQNLGVTLRRLRELLVPKGRILAFYTHGFSKEQISGDEILSHHTPLAGALRDAGLAYQVTDFSQKTYELLQRKRLLAEEMRDRFSAEGRVWLYDHLSAEAADPEIQYNPNTVGQRRYLYHAQQQDAADG